jgi:hypothetical protein
MSKSIRRLVISRLGLTCLLAAALLAASISIHASDDPFDHGFIPSALAVSRVQYDGNSFGSTETFPTIFSDPAITGIQGSIFIDQYLPVPGVPRLGSLALTGITTSFSSKSEGALMRSANGAFLTYMGYQGPVGANGVSNSETPGATLTTNTAPTFNREVALISADGSVSLTPETNAFSGDNPRACINRRRQAVLYGGQCGFISQCRWNWSWHYDRSATWHARV